MGLGTQSAMREGSRRTDQEAGTRGREGGGRKGRGGPRAPLPPPCPPSSLLRSALPGRGMEPVGSFGQLKVSSSRRDRGAPVWRLRHWPCAQGWEGKAAAHSPAVLFSCWLARARSWAAGAVTRADPACPAVYSPLSLGCIPHRDRRVSGVAPGQER